MGELKFYKCHTTVHAEPMTKGEFYSLYGSMFSRPSPDEGYRVIYNMGVPDKEYHCWLYKEEFENGYTEIGKVPVTKAQMEAAMDEAQETFEQYGDPDECPQQYMDSFLCCYFGVDDVSYLEVTND